MSTSFSDGSSLVPRPVIDLSYPSIAREDNRDSSRPSTVQTGRSGPSPEEVEILVSRARADGEGLAEKRIRQEYEQRSGREKLQIAAALEAIARERVEYFARVESQVVQLALAIAAKILHREAKVDPKLMAALVRIAIENMNVACNIKVRVRPEEAENWRKWFDSNEGGPTVLVVEDSSVETGSCFLDTEMGSAEFGIDAQLKEVERGFLDLLAQRPS